MKNNDTRLTLTTRRQAILDAAMDTAEAVGYALLTRDDVAERAGCSPGLVQFHFNTMHELKNTIISEAIRTERLSVLAQAVGAAHDEALAVDGALFSRVLGYIRERKENAG